MTTLELHTTVRVRFAPRATFDGQPMLPECAEYVGREARALIGWLMGADDRYPGEYALMSADSGYLFGRLWIASGDVEVLDASPAPGGEG